MALYWSYGSNLDPVRMRQRCPSARMVGPLYFNNAKLVFRAVADVVTCEGSRVPGGLWEIDERDERELDRYEGVSSGLYARWHVTKKIDGRKRRILFYKMNEAGIMPPSARYLDTIMCGYRAFGLDMSYLETALAESHDDKTRTEYLDWRYERDRPRLAPRDHVKPRHNLEERIKEGKPATPKLPSRLTVPMYGVTHLIKKKENATDKFIRYLDRKNKGKGSKLSRKGM